MHQKITIALDMMSGDHGASSSVPAAIDTLERFNDIFLILVGDQKKINAFLSDKTRALEGIRYKIIHTEEFISMNDEIIAAIRTKKNSSMRLGINAVKDKNADACVSAGNTGALMALSKIILK